METVLVLVGCWVGQFRKDLRFFKELEKRFKCRVKKINKFLYETQINNIRIKFQFVFGPNKDRIWMKREALSKKKGSRLPPPISLLTQDQIKAKRIFYLGFCGILGDKKRGVFLPDKFSKVNFSNYYLNENSYNNLKFQREICFDNKLLKQIKGERCKSVTTNQVLSLNYVKDNSEKILSKISKKLSKKADIVEMEGYEIVRKLKNKGLCGLFYYGSDNPSKKGKQLGNKKHNFNPDWFNKPALELIKKITC